MTTSNNGLQFYKLYYEDSEIRWSQSSDRDKKKNQQIFGEQNKKLFKATLPQAEKTWAYADNFTSIELTTIYPGLLLGSGLSHGSGLLGELKLGFFFDYTTGLPVVAGSSVKGVLRSAFPQLYQAKHPEKAKQITKLIQYYLHEVTEKNWTTEAVDALESFIFGTLEPGKNQAKKSNPGNIIFHDAVPINASRVPVNGQYQNNYLGGDYITPHSKPLKNPIPIGFLKVLPGVVFRFQFALSEFTVQDKEETFTLNPTQQEALFTMILLDLGVGAKTNVGYGQFMTPAHWDQQYPKLERPAVSPQGNDRRSNVRRSPAPPPPPPPPRGREQTPLATALKKDLRIKATIVSTENNSVLFELADEAKTKLHKSTASVVKRLKTKFKIDTPPKVEDAYWVIIQADAPEGSTKVNFSIKPVI